MSLLSARQQTTSRLCEVAFRERLWSLTCLPACLPACLPKRQLQDDEAITKASRRGSRVCMGAFEAFSNEAERLSRAAARQATISHVRPFNRYLTLGWTHEPSLNAHLCRLIVRYTRTW